MRASRAREARITRPAPGTPGEGIVQPAAKAVDQLSRRLHQSPAPARKGRGFPGTNETDLEAWLARRASAASPAKIWRGSAAQTQGAEADALVAATCREAQAQIVPVAVPPTFADPPSGWQWHRLTGIAQLESGHTPSLSRPDWWGGNVSWIWLTGIRALDGQWVESAQLRTNAQGIANSAARIPPRGTVCFARTASVGFAAIMRQPMATRQDFANWVCSDALDPEFLMHALIRSHKALREPATGATHKTIYMPTLESFHVCAPGIDRQRRRSSARRAGSSSQRLLPSNEDFMRRVSPTPPRTSKNG